MPYDETFVNPKRARHEAAIHALPVGQSPLFQLSIIPTFQLRAKRTMSNQIKILDDDVLILHPHGFELADHGLHHG